MRKVILGSLVVLLIAAVLAAGCGSKSSTANKPSSQVQKVISENQSKMQDVKTVKMAGKATVLTPQSETKQENVTYTAEMKLLSKQDVEMHMTATESNGKKSEMYIVGGYLYSNDPAKGWVKEKVQPGNQQTSMMTPSGVADLMKYASNMKMGTTSGSDYVITFDVGSKLFEQIFNQAVGSTPSTAPESEAEKQLAQSMKDMLKGLQMGVVYKINKSTMLADSATITVAMKGTPVIGDMSVDMALTFTDYNVPVTITLPPEAQNAPEVQANPSGIPNIPSIPGLGL
jgi:predicted small lipoprotein YifL